MLQLTPSTHKSVVLYEWLENWALDCDDAESFLPRFRRLYRHRPTVLSKRKQTFIHNIFKLDSLNLIGNIKYFPFGFGCGDAGHLIIIIICTTAVNNR